MAELQLRGLTVRHGVGRTAVTAVDGVDLCVPAGKVVGLVGESGCGKSTLARATVGLVPVADGEILLDGELLRSRPGRRERRRVQMVFQDPNSSLDPRLSIGESVAEAIPKEVARGPQERRAEVVRLLGLVGLDPDRAGVLPRQISGGQRQRVALARALAARPDAIIADEVTSALDVSVQATILNLLRDLQARLGLSMLFISHDLAVVRYVSDIVAVMQAGSVVECGPTDQVFTAPRHEYTRELLAAVAGPGEESR
jgi:peptide/nickel transport system ATP-binding protein